MTHRGFMNKRSNSVSRSDYVLVTRCRKEYEYHHILCKHNIWARLPYGVLTGHVNLLLALFMREAFGFGSPWQVLSRVGVRGSLFYEGAPVGLLFVRAMGSSIGFDILRTRLKSVTAPVRPNRFCQESLISSEFEQIELFRAHHHAHDQSDLRVHDHVLTYDEVTILTTFSFVWSRRRRLNFKYSCPPRQCFKLCLYKLNIIIKLLN